MAVGRHDACHRGRLWNDARQRWDRRSRQRRARRIWVRRSQRRCKTQEADEKLAMRINPGLGNPYEKRKLMETLRSDKRVSTGDQVAADSTVTSTYTSSSKFFRGLQEEQDAGAKTVDTKVKNKKSKKTKSRGQVGSLKL